jgi:hypothetical protein
MRSMAGPIALAAILVACSSSDTSTDDDAPACSGASSNGLVTEQTQAEECPTSPMMLTGTVGYGGSCSQAKDCAPYCCTCPAGGGADAAQCSNGTCLDQQTTCCLYALQCGQ